MFKLYTHIWANSSLKEDVYEPPIGWHIVDSDFEVDVFEDANNGIVNALNAFEKIYKENNFSNNFIRFCKFEQTNEYPYKFNYITFSQLLKKNINNIKDENYKKQLEKYLVLL
jgi:hypothetical protein